LFSAKTKKHLTEGLTALGLISNAKFMARLSDWMGARPDWGGGGMAGLPSPALGSANVCVYFLACTA